MKMLRTLLRMDKIIKIRFIAADKNILSSFNWVERVDGASPRGYQRYGLRRSLHPRRDFAANAQEYHVDESVFVMLT